MYAFMAGLLASLAGTMGQVRKEAAHSGRMSAGGQARHPLLSSLTLKPTLYLIKNNTLL